MSISNLIGTIREDAIFYLDYRNSKYSINYRWPDSKFSQFKYIYNLFSKNVNGFRDLFYYRINYLKGHKIFGRGILLIINLLKLMYKPTSNLVLDVGHIEKGGCVFHHPFSTFINAEFIGKGCSFRNNITIGNKIINGKTYRPILEEGVFVGPNSVIIGKITIGKYSVIGAGAVVVKDVPPYAIVAGNPAKILRYER